MHILGNISIETFLSKYWQKKPLLIRNAFPEFESPIEPDDLAGLSLEDAVESRIIKESDKNGPWQLYNGPFNEADFEQLPEEKWTLLVQAVDQWVPEISDLLDHFKFIPSWRLDDIMASFAPKGGSVGPHYDQYDVFLLQATGQRKWQVGPKFKPDDKLVENTPLSILQEIIVEHEWTLNPGDMLYLPPMYAHNGVAQNDCMTFSVGFRAPSETDIIQGISDHICSKLEQPKHYQDPNLIDASKHPALINDKAIEDFQSLLLSQLQDKSNVAQWLAEYMTQSKYEELLEPLEEPLEWEDVAPLLQTSGSLLQNETSRFAYFNQDDKTSLYTNGLEQNIDCDNTNLAVVLANNKSNLLSDLAPLLQIQSSQELLLDLINQNTLYFEGL
jgi:50S ribosomal protein L16 3-hydroxylase